MKEIKTLYETKALTTNWQTLIWLHHADAGYKPIKAIFAIYGAYKSSHSPFTLNFRLTDDLTADTPLCIWESGDVVFNDEEDSHNITTIPECFFWGDLASLSLQAKVVSGDNDNLEYSIYIYDALADLDIYSYRGSALLTAADVADAILETPANLLATDANGRVDLGAVGGTTVTGPNDLKANVSALATSSALATVNSTVNTISSNVTTIDGIVDAIKLSTDSLSSNVSSIGKFDGLPTLITKLSHHYKLNELSGTTVVDSVGDLDGVASTNITALTKPGKINTCFYNDTGLRYVDLQDDLSEIFSKSFSINLWVKAVSATNNGYFFGASKAGGGEKLTMAVADIGSINTINVFYNDYEGASLLTVEGVDITDWTMLTLVMTTTGVSSLILSLYVNGVFSDSANMSLAYSSWDCSNIYLLNANANEVPASTFVGSLDSVMIFNNVLTQDEITYLYNGGFGVEELVDISSVKAKTDLLTNIDTSIEFINTQLASMVDYDTTDGYRFTSESLAQGPTESSDLVTLTTTINQIKRLIDSN